MGRKRFTLYWYSAKEGKRSVRRNLLCEMVDEGERKGGVRSV